MITLSVMLNLAHDAVHGFPEPPSSNPALAAALLESVAAIAAECDLMRRSTLHYPVTKHLHAIEDCLRDIVVEVTGISAIA